MAGSRQEESCVYLALEDAKLSIGQKVNLLASVLHSGPSAKTKRSDYECRLVIEDASTAETRIPVFFSADAEDRLPHVKSPGDIIAIHRVLMTIREKEIVAAFNKKNSSFALFEGKSSDNFKPYLTSPKFQTTDHDKDSIKHLRTWLLDNQFGEGAIENMLPMRDIRTGHSFDLVCKLLHVCEVSESHWMLFVWDGTDAPPAGFETSLETEAWNPVLLHLEPSLARDVLCTFPRVGTVLRIDAGKYFKEIGLKSVGIGKWVKFRNIVCHLRSGLWYGVLTPSRIQLLPDEDNVVEQRERCYSRRHSSDMDVLCWIDFLWPSPITEIDFKQMKFSTLMDVLCHSQGIARFRSVIRVVAIFPWRADNFWSPNGRSEYRMRLTLEDPTARLHAYVYGDDGEKFFGGFPPPHVLTRKINKLLGVTETNGMEEGCTTLRNPPWVQCHIKSYCRDRSNPWNTRRFRIYGTKLID